MRAFIIISLAIFISHASSVHAGGDWTFATNWIGKYPSMPVGATKSGLLSQTEIRASLKKLLPKFEVSNLSGLTSEVPVRDIEGLLVVNKCRPHNCPSDMATVVVDVKKAQLWIGFFSREASRFQLAGTVQIRTILFFPKASRKTFLYAMETKFVRQI